MLALVMTSPEGITLKTGGKYCPENIHITPDLPESAAPDAEVTVTASISDSYALLRYVTEAASGSLSGTTSIPGLKVGDCFVICSNASNGESKYASVSATGAAVQKVNSTVNGHPYPASKSWATAALITITEPTAAITVSI